MKKDITELSNSSDYSYLSFDPSRLANLLAYLDENTIPALVGFNDYGRVTIITPYNSDFEDWAKHHLHLVKITAPATREYYIQVILDTLPTPSSPLTGHGFWVDMSEDDELELWPSSKKLVTEIYHDTLRDRFVFDIDGVSLQGFIEGFRDQHPDKVWGIYPPGSQEAGGDLVVVSDWRDEELVQTFKGHLVSFDSALPPTHLTNVERRLTSHGVKVDTAFDIETGVAYLLFPHSLPQGVVKELISDIHTRLFLPTSPRLKYPDHDGYHTIKGMLESRHLGIGKLRAKTPYHHGCTCLRWTYSYTDRMTALQWLVNCGLELTLSHDGEFDYLLVPLVMEDAAEELKTSLQSYLGDNEVQLVHED